MENEGTVIESGTELNIDLAKGLSTTVMVHQVRKEGDVVTVSFSKPDGQIFTLEFNEDENDGTE